MNAITSSPLTSSLGVLSIVATAMAQQGILPQYSQPASLIFTGIGLLFSKDGNIRR